MSGRQAVYQRDARRCANLLPETLASILAQANVTAGSRLLVWEDLPGALLTGAVAERLGGYGQVFSIYTGPYPSSHEVCVRQFNMSFGVQSTIHWVHAADMFPKDDDDDDDEETDGEGTNDDSTHGNKKNTTFEACQSEKGVPNSSSETNEDVDLEAQERDAMSWPCPLQDHTREYLKTSSVFGNEQQQQDFFNKRCRRFARKLTRPSPLECAQLLKRRPVDALILAIRNVDLVSTVQDLWRYLAPSAPVVIFSEYVEPLTQVFAFLQQQQQSPPQQQQQQQDSSPHEQTFTHNGEDDHRPSFQSKSPAKAKQQQLQQADSDDDVDEAAARKKDDNDDEEQKVNIGAIQLRLTAGWTREYQVLPQRTHPCMNMTQNGGYLLTGTKLHEIHGCQNELDPYVLSQIRATMPTRRGKKRKPAEDKGGTGGSSSGNGTGNATTKTNGSKRGKGQSSSGEEAKCNEMELDKNIGESRNSDITNEKELDNGISPMSNGNMDSQTMMLSNTVTPVCKRKTPRKRKRPTKLPTSRSSFDDDDDADDEQEEDEAAMAAAAAEKEAAAAKLRRKRGDRPRQIRILYGPDIESLFFSKKRRKQAQPKQRPTTLEHVPHPTGASVVSVPSDDN